MRKPVFLAFLILLWFSCGSSPLPPENIEFQNKMGVNFTFIKRGIYSIPKEYNDIGFDDYYSRLVNNQILFSVNESQNEFAVFVDDGENILIKINPLLSKFSSGSKNVLLTATVYAIGLLKIGNTGLPVIEERFYKVISDYGNFGVDVSSILNDNMYKNHSFKITNKGINM